jgi:hypothetical protein
MTRRAPRAKTDRQELEQIFRIAARMAIRGGRRPAAVLGALLQVTWDCAATYNSTDDVRAWLALHLARLDAPRGLQS